MAELEVMTLDEMLADLDAHPPDDPRHALAAAIRESDDDALKGWVIIGEDDGRPTDYAQFLALGWVNGGYPPKYCLVPGPDDAAGQVEIAGITAALVNEHPRKIAIEDLRPLLAGEVKTLVHLTYGRRRDDGSAYIVLWHHPTLELRQAAYLALVAIESDRLRRSGSGS